MINPIIRRKHKLKKPTYNKTFLKNEGKGSEADNFYPHGACLICNKADASKTNSHLVPSFLVSMYDSYDNSGKRGKDLQFTFTNTGRSVYVGAIPSTKYEEIFDDESINDNNRLEELKNNPDAKDFVFCPSCEILLAERLEAPYADTIKQNKAINGTVAYFFWLSVIWRMGACGMPFGFSLPKDILESMRHVLNSFLEIGGLTRERLSKTSNIFEYKLLYCPNYCKTNGGFQYCNYENGVLTFFISDFILVGYFGSIKNLPSNYMFECLKDYINQANMNNGLTENEQKQEIDPKIMKAAINTFIHFAIKVKEDYYAKTVSQLWEQLNIPIPLTTPIIREILCEIFSEDTKLAERESVHSIAIAIESVLRSHGVIIR